MTLPPFHAATPKIASPGRLISGTFSGRARRDLQALPAVRCAFQPIIDARSGDCFAYEALIRGAGGEPASRVFCSIQPGQEAALDRLCRDTAVQTAAELKMPPHCALSINVAGCSVGQADEWLPKLVRSAETLGLAPSSLILELTEEDSVIGPKEMARFATACRDQGVRVAVDDFGTGRSGLLRLIETRPDIIKIDRSLLHEAPGDATRIAVLSATIRLCQDIEALVIAEGVETLDEYQLLRGLGVSLFQGWLIGRPTLGALAAAHWPEADAATISSDTLDRLKSYTC